MIVDQTNMLANPTSMIVSLYNIIVSQTNMIVDQINIEQANMTVFLPHTVTLSNQPKNLSVIVYLFFHIHRLYMSA